MNWDLQLPFLRRRFLVQECGYKELVELTKLKKKIQGKESNRELKMQEVVESELE